MKKRFIISCSITFAIGLLMFFGVLSLRHVYDEVEAKEVIKGLCDGAFVPGIIIFGFGLLVVVAKGGTFDMLAYGIIRFFALFKRDVTNVKYKTFYEYRKASGEKERYYSHHLIVGGFFLLVSLIFLVIYLNL